MQHHLCMDYFTCGLISCFLKYDVKRIKPTTHDILIEISKGNYNTGVNKFDITEDLMSSLNQIITASNDVFRQSSD